MNFPPAHESHAHDLGLQHDLGVISQQQAQRRRLFRYLLGGGALAVMSGCGGGDEAAATLVNSGTGGTAAGTSTSTGTSVATTTTGTGACVVDPEETNGPYPSDGSNSVNGAISNVLVQSGIMRSDIRSSFGGASAVAAGVPLTLDITVVNVNASCAPLAGWALYVWHCTADGNYSLYANSLRNENYLRGVQVTDTSGKLRFTTVFPGCYSGRYPHIHFELFQSLGVATGYVNRVLASQMALPRDACTAVYGSTSGYGSSTANLAGVTLANDNVFGNNSAAQIAAQTIALTGSPAAGYAGSIVVGVNW